VDIPNIINTVAATLLWDVFLMGLFVTLAGLLAVSVFFDPVACWKSLWARRQPFKRSPTSIEKATILGLIALITVYYAGIISNSLTDKLVDQVPFFLTDKEIKIQVCQSTFPSECDACLDAAKPFYNYAKNILWPDKDWQETILYSQRMINIARVWVFSFLLVFLSSVVGVFRLLGVGNSRGEGGRILSLLVLSLLFSFLGMVVWHENEREVDAKIFGIYQSLERKPIKKLPNIRVEGPSDFVATEAPNHPGVLDMMLDTESSGLTWYGDKLVVVNDDDNRINIYSDDGVLEQHIELKLRSGDAIEKPAKFEDITYDEKHRVFYVIGAHKKNKPNQARTFRFRLSQKRGGWTATDVSLVMGLAKRIQDAIGNRADTWVEGITVRHEGRVSHLLVGLRTEDSSPNPIVPILEFEIQKDHFEYKQEYTLVLTEGSVRDYARLSSKEIPLHLSALTLAPSGELLVLTATEVGKNEFHGNRIYAYRLGEGILARKNYPSWQTPGLFANGQKAEGLAVWRSQKKTLLVGSDLRRERIALAFDNDGKIPSRLVSTKELCSAEEWLRRNGFGGMTPQN